MREDWRVLLDVARQLKRPLAWNNVQEIFSGLTEAVEVFSGLNHDEIGSGGISLEIPKSMTGADVP